MTIIIVLLFTIIIILLLYKVLNWYIKRKKIFEKLKHIPGPTSLPLIGNALDFKSCEDIIPSLTKYQKQYGLTYKVQLGLDPYVFTSDPDLLEAITLSSTQITKTKLYRFLKDWLGNGLVSSTNPTWITHRRMMRPSFHFKILKDFLPVFQKNANNLVDHWNNEIGKQNCKQTNVFYDISSCVLDIIYETAMGLQINALREGKESMYMNSVRSLGKTVMERSFSFWKQFDSLYRLSSLYKNQIKCVSQIKATTENIIKRKRAEIATNPDVYKQNAEDKDIGAKRRMAFLDYMMEAVNESGGKMSNEELREEVDTIVFTGHETTAVASSYILYNLSMNPDVQQKVYEEIITLPENDITYEQLNSLKYLEMVIKESLRIFPTAPLIFRLLTDDVVYNGQHYPKGLSFGCFIYGALLNSEFFEEPEKFMPERFTPESTRKRHPFAYIPFSAGPRNCIGQKFAMMEMKSIVAALVRHFKFTKAKDFKLCPVAEGLLISQTGVQVIIEKRKI